MLNYEDIFTTRLYSKSLQIDNNLLIEEIYRIQEKHYCEYRTNVGGWQSGDLNPDLLNNLNCKEFINLITNINNTLFEISNTELLPTLTIDNIWVNINSKYNFNWDHIHPGSVLSGSYYVKVPDKKNVSVEFIQPDTFIESMYSHWAAKSDIYKNYLTHSKIYNIEENLLLMFPGHLKHRVYPNISDEKRISIAFNTRYN